MRGKKRRNSSSHLQWLVVAPSPVPPRWGALAREFLDQGRVVPERSVVVSRCVLKLEGESVSGRGYGMREGSPSRSPASVPLRLERLSTASRSSFNSRFLSTLPLLSLYSPLHRGDDRAPFARGNAPPLGSICDDADACRNAKAGSNKVSREVSKPPGHERVRLRLGSRRAGRASILGELVGLGRCREEHGFEFVTEREKKKKKRKTLQFLKSLFFLSLEFLAAPLLAPPHKTTRPDTQKQVENGRGSRKASFEVSVQKRACLVPTSSRKVVERARQHFDENVELAAENFLLAHSRSAKEEEDESGKKSSMSFSGFQRPGTRSSGRAFGISLSVDSAVSASGQAAAIDAASKPLSLTNHHPSTAAVSSAVAAAKNQLLFLVERHAVVVVQGEPNGGKADKVRSFCFLFLC